MREEPYITAPAATSPEAALLLNWRQIADCIPTGVVLFDPNLTVLYANTEAQRLLPSGQSLQERLPSSNVDEAQRTEQLLRVVFTSAEPVVIPRLQCLEPSGSHRLLQLTARLLPDAQLQLAILALHEITEITNLEQRLAASERMAAVGRLAAKVAHELNNPLDGIMRYVALAQRRLRDNQPDELPRYLDDMQFGLKRMAEIVRELLEFGHNATAISPVSDLIYIIDQAVRTMQPVADRAGVQVVCSHRSALAVRAGTNMYQVLCNIIKNGVDAMPGGGLLTIINDREGEWAVVRVLDSGRGIRPEDMPSIFEPFFSTKPLGQGTGLGLAVCKEIMDKMGGSITAVNRPEGGCEFILRLPGLAGRGA